jgi:hypothetical protein
VAAGVAAVLAYLIVIRVFADEAARGKAFPGWLPFLLGAPFAALVAWITSGRSSAMVTHGSRK